MNEQKARRGRDEGAREQIRSEHREHDRQRERDEQILRGPGEHHDRKKDDADRESRRERGNGDLARGVEDRHRQGLFHVAIAVDVLDFDGGVVDEHADREREAAEGHRVQGLSRQKETQHADEDGHRNRHRDDEHAPPAADEGEDHQGHQPRGDGALPQHALYGRAHEHRLIELDLELEVLRGSKLHRGDQLAHGVDHRDGGRAGLAQDGQVGGALAVHADDVLLHRESVVRVGDVPDVDRRPVDDPQGDLVELLGQRRAAVDADVELGRSHPREARRDDDVLREHPVHDVRRREPRRHELVGVKVDRELAGGAPVGRRRGQPGDGEEPEAQEVQAVVVELLLVHRLAGHRELRDRNVGRVELQHHRRRDPRRHEAARGEGDRRDLGDRCADVGVLLEVNAQNPEALDGRGVDVLDSGDRRGVGALADVDDAPLHVLRAEAVVVPDDDHDRDVDARQHVRDHARGRQRPQQQHAQAEDGDRVRTAQRQADDPHGRPRQRCKRCATLPVNDRAKRPRRGMPGRAREGVLAYAGLGELTEAYGADDRPTAPCPNAPPMAAMNRCAAGPACASARPWRIAPISVVEE